MNEQIPELLGIIAGRGAYPGLLAESARAQGVKRIFAVAFRRETDPVIKKHVDDVEWIHIGQLASMLNALAGSGVKHVVMAGQITPTHLFRVRLDVRMMALLKRLGARNAETIFGAIADELKAQKIKLMPASMFMESHMPAWGLLSDRPPTEEEQRDIDLGVTVAATTSGLDIGQTVVVKKGTILAVEAFEGTDETLERAGRLGGEGAIIVKIAKKEHDMRFDIPVIGLHTMKLLRKIKASVLAVEAGRSILLEREKIIEQANRMHLCLTAINSDEK